MSSVNKVIILGRLTKDPETRLMPNGEGVTNFTIVTSEQWKDKQGVKQEKSEFHNCVAYRKLSEIIQQYMKKGSQIYIEGKLQTDKYEKDGVTKYSTKIIVNELTMLGGKAAGSNSEEPENKPVQEQSKPTAKSSFDDFDSSIPF